MLRDGLLALARRRSASFEAQGSSLTRGADASIERDVSERRPYVPPQLVQVQRRLPGDNLSTGCKSAATGGPTENPCESGADPCQTADTS